MNANDLDALSPSHFDVVILDEFHHAAAPSYERVLDHLLAGLGVGAREAGHAHVALEVLEAEAGHLLARHASRADDVLGEVDDQAGQHDLAAAGLLGELAGGRVREYAEQARALLERRNSLATRMLFWPATVSRSATSARVSS